MNLGRLDHCLRVASAARSRAFYERLGFVVVEGDTVEGWLVMASGTARLGLFEPRYMGDDVFSLNFRGGDIPRLVDALAAQGVDG
jgi:hypothetical protein